MRSCIYEGTVSHIRRRPINHQFDYRLFMVMLDLEEMPSIVGRYGLIGKSRHSSRAFLRSDHLFQNSLSLGEEVRQIIQHQTGKVSAGPIRLLTQLRYWGMYFSPLNLFFVFDESDRNIEFIVAEVTNTPWKERHCYVLWDGNRAGSSQELAFLHPKQFHVSPFMGMDQQYSWQISAPEDSLSIQLGSIEAGAEVFQAGMKLQRRDLNAAQLRRMTRRFPLMTAKISAAIYIQALKLRWKKCPFYKHPNKTEHALTNDNSMIA